MKTSHPEYFRWVKIKHRYGLTKESFGTKLKKQDSKCTLCGTHLKDTSKTVVDHDHNTNIVRDILCQGCNVRLGHFEKTLRKSFWRLVRYIIKHRLRHLAYKIPYLCRMAGRTATYYKNNPKSYAKKKKKDAEDGKSRERTKKRVEANRKRRKAKRNGKDVRGKDYDHATDSFVDSSVNRGRKGEGNRKKKAIKKKKKGVRAKKKS